MYINLWIVGSRGIRITANGFSLITYIPRIAEN